MGSKREARHGTPYNGAVACPLPPPPSPPTSPPTIRPGAPTVIVLGAGVIGLCVARALRERGAAVTVLDASPAAREASWAAGGILGLGTEYAADGPGYRLARFAFDRWDEVARRLREETGIPLEVTHAGTLLIPKDAAEATALEARGAFHRSVGLASRMLDGPAARGVEPRLAPGIGAALWVPEARLDNRRLLDALDAACRRLEIPVLVGVRALRCVEAGGRIVGVETPEGRRPADAVVVATGAWSEEIAATAGLALPMVPVKGQMLRLDAPDGFLGPIVKQGPQYLVPQAGRGIVVGTTAEDVGFARGTDEAALGRIRAAAVGLVPDVASLPRIEAWAGFRPRLPDLLPALGPVASRPGLFLATGHFRNGILLCEATGELVARAVLGDVDPRLAAFDPERFARRPRP